MTRYLKKSQWTDQFEFPWPWLEFKKLDFTLTCALGNNCLNSEIQEDLQVEHPRAHSIVHCRKARALAEGRPWPALVQKPLMAGGQYMNCTSCSLAE